MPTIIKRFLVFMYDLRVRINLRRKARKILDNLASSKTLGKIPAGYIKSFRKTWKAVSGKPDSDWLRIYGSISGVWDLRFVPEPVYYNSIEPRLNNKAFSKASTDKNLYSRLPDFLNFPVIIVKNIEGVFYDNSDKHITTDDAISAINGCKSFIIKPAVDSGGGKGVQLCIKDGDRFRLISGGYIDLKLLIRDYGYNYVVQDVIEPHPFYSAYNSSSLNTVRVLTYRSVVDERIHILHYILRVGRKGSVTDNQASGGYACGVTRDGMLTGMAVDKYGNIYKEVNGTKLIAGTWLEGFDKITDTAKKTGQMFPYSRLLGLDLCIDKDCNPRVIEINNLHNEINFFQMLNGPLFGDFTDEIISWCSKRKKSFLIDFDL